ncbi:hypothetical protein O6H91_01G145800 [Diphasiastrum complanatum]|uniref:Uncharacterized protein n=1 Tax=Diphasiastrum complanatum TaxID=34168 RepID=A0ACC2EX79_DIPCM|nr:hypothetical protein O6H91_01G145800 [Diphasiastrum complanatum]
MCWIFHQEQYDQVLCYSKLHTNSSSSIMLLDAAFAGFTCDDDGDGDSVFGLSDFSAESSPSHFHNSTFNESREFELQQQYDDASPDAAPANLIPEAVDSLPLEEIFSRLVQVTEKRDGKQLSQQSANWDLPAARSAFASRSIAAFDWEADGSPHNQQKASAYKLPRRYKSFNTMYPKKWRSLSGKFKNLLQGKLSQPVNITDFSMNPAPSRSASKNQLYSRSLNQSHAGEIQTSQQHKSKELMRDAFAVASSTRSSERHSANLSIHNPNKPRPAIPFPASFSASHAHDTSEALVKCLMSVNAISHAIPDSPDRNHLTASSSPLVQDSAACQHILPGTSLYGRAKSGPMARPSAHLQKEFRRLISFSGPQPQPSGHKSLANLHLPNSSSSISTKNLSRDRPSPYTSQNMKPVHLDQTYAKSQYHTPREEYYCSDTSSNFSIEFSGKLSQSTETRSNAEVDKNRDVAVASSFRAPYSKGHKHGSLVWVPSFTQRTNPTFRARSISSFSGRSKTSKKKLFSAASMSRFARSDSRSTPSFSSVRSTSDFEDPVSKGQGRRTNFRLESQVSDEPNRGKEMTKMTSVNLLQKLMKAHASMRKNHKLRASIRKRINRGRWGSMWKKTFSCFYVNTDSTRRAALKIRALTDR